MYIRFKQTPQLEKGIKKIEEYNFTAFNEKEWGFFCDNIKQYLPADYQGEPFIEIYASKDKMPKANLIFYHTGNSGSYVNIKLNPFEVFTLTKDGTFKRHEKMSYEWERIMYLNFKDAYLEGKERYFAFTNLNSK